MQFPNLTRKERDVSCPMFVCFARKLVASCECDECIIREKGYLHHFISLIRRKFVAPTTSLYSRQVGMKCLHIQVILLT